VVAVRRDATAIADLAADGVEVRSADLRRDDAARELPPAVDAVVACQSAGGPTPDDYRRSYVEVNRRLAGIARAAGAGRFVYSGSTGVFGATDGRVVDEATPPDPTTGTGAVLAEAEAVVREAAGCVVRLSGLYGPGRYGTISRVRSGALALGPGDDAWMNFCHREDAVRAVVAALDRGRPGATYHGTDAHPPRRAEVVRWVSERLGIDPPRAASPPARAANRRVSGERTRAELGFDLAYPSFREGFAAAFTG